MARAKKTTTPTTAPTETPVGISDEMALIEQAGEAVVDDLRDQAVTLPQEALRQSLRLSQQAGIIGYARYMEEANRLMRLKTIWEIKAAKAYKGMVLPHAKTGRPVTVKTFDEFCEAIGESRSAVDEALGNLAFFGESLIEKQDQLGLTRKDLRVMKAVVSELPDAEQQALLHDIDQMTDREDVMATLGELQVTTKKQAKALREKDANYASQSEVLKQKNEKIQDLELQLHKLTTVTPDESDAARQQRDAEIRKAITEACHEFTGLATKVANFAAVPQAEAYHLVEWANQTVSLTCETINDIFAGAGLDVQLGLDWGQEELAAPEDDTATPETVQQ